MVARGFYLELRLSAEIHNIEDARQEKEAPDVGEWHCIFCDNNSFFIEKNLETLEPYTKCTVCGYESGVMELFD